MISDNINKLKKKLLFDSDVKNDLLTPIDQKGIKNLIPHREPFLLLDTIELVNLEQRLIKTTRWIDPKDPLFKGHYPDNPIYPGVLLQEIMFQSCLALFYFIANDTTQIPKAYSAIDAVGTRAYDIYNISSVLPEDTLSIYCHILAHDELLTTGIAQACVEKRVCCVGKGEFYVT